MFLLIYLWLLLYLFDLFSTKTSICCLMLICLFKKLSFILKMAKLVFSCCSKTVKYVAMIWCIWLLVDATTNFTPFSLCFIIVIFTLILSILLLTLVRSWIFLFLFLLFSLVYIIMCKFWCIDDTVILFPQLIVGQYLISLSQLLKFQIVLHSFIWYIRMILLS